MAPHFQEGPRVYMVINTVTMPELPILPWIEINLILKLTSIINISWRGMMLINFAAAIKMGLTGL